MITTAQVLAERALNEACGQSCVEWAISMLEQGKDGTHLRMLASMSPPFNHFEVAEYRDRSLEELGVGNTADAEAINMYAAEVLRLAATDEAELPSALARVKDLCVGFNYPKNLYDFYLLHFAYSDLQDSEVQWYWKGADRSNIDSIIEERVRAFLSSSSNACNA